MEEKGGKFGSQMEDKNANVATIIHQHPFLNGLKDAPQDKQAEVDALRTWLLTQPHLPQLTGRRINEKREAKEYN